MEKNASLGWLFLAVQLVDIAFFIFVFLGIERLNIVENFTEATHFELEYMPYTHSLVGALAWAVIAFGAFRLFLAREVENKKRIALVIAAAVFSHWLLDLVVHTPDLPLLGDNSTKVGLGLWNSALLTLLLEALLLIAGAWLFLREFRGSPRAPMSMAAFVVLLMLINFINIYGPPPGSENYLIAVSLLSYFAFGGIAFWLDRKITKS